MRALSLNLAAALTLFVLLICPVASKAEEPLAFAANAGSPGPSAPPTSLPSKPNGEHVVTMPNGTHSQQPTRQIKPLQHVKAGLRAKVAAELRYQEFVRLSDLTTNPYRYKGRVIAVETKFGRMLSENEAVFDQFGHLVARGVPPALFKGHERVILAIRVVGNTDDMSGVLADYVGAYKCVQEDCSEYF